MTTYTCPECKSDDLYRQTSEPVNPPYNSKRDVVLCVECGNEWTATELVKDEN